MLPRLMGQSHACYYYTNPHYVVKFLTTVHLYIVEFPFFVRGKFNASPPGLEPGLPQGRID